MSSNNLFKLSQKHLLVEILPRAMWLVEGACLLLVQRITHQTPYLTNNAIQVVLGIAITLIFAFFAVWSFRTLMRAMVTKELITKGLYKYIRHPIYVGMYGMLIGIGLLFFSTIWFVVLLIFIPVWYLISCAEEKQMTDLWGDKYREYKLKTGMFFPKI